MILLDETICLLAGFIFCFFIPLSKTMLTVGWFLCDLASYCACEVLLLMISMVSTNVPALGSNHQWFHHLLFYYIHRCSQIKKYILESYDVKIPDKAKELLLTLTGVVSLSSFPFIKYCKCSCKPKSSIFIHMQLFRG